MKNNILLIQRLLNKQAKKSYQHNQYGMRHVNAWQSSPIAKMIDGFAKYAEEYVKRYDAVLSDDYVLGEAWADGLKAVRALLNGELGSLDGGMTDEIILELAKNNGFKEEDF